ncbi:uncharacterized protein G2W53_033584 [Senna tora]|uniref:Uncharacterized protein n=1 Tax=Senna tora TaxID=362788 RepID=A0A834SZG0_9FABA|nr:uncharacterized protein G2W53_033584 [Senna tora]
MVLKQLVNNLDRVTLADNSNQLGFRVLVDVGEL